MSVPKIILALFTCFLIIISQSVICSAQSVVKEGASPEIMIDGFQFTEGPLWHPDGYLLFSDIPANTIFKWHPDSSEASVFIKPSGNSNGIEMGKSGDIIIAQHAGQIGAIGEDNNVDTLASSYEGNRLNSPNDIAVRSDGTIYFTDPPFGVSDEDKELDISGVYRISDGGTIELLYDQLSLPNGIVFSPDEEILYVNDTADGRILAFDVTTDGNVSLPEMFASVGEPDSTGAADGMIVDSEGRLYSSGPGGIYVFTPAGKQIQQINVPAQVTNLEWGGEARNELYITTPTSIYRLQMNTHGLKPE